MYSEDAETGELMVLWVCACGTKADIPRSMWGHGYKCQNCNRPVAILENGVIIRRIK